jgi:hypothetical protein
MKKTDNFEIEEPPFPANFMLLPVPMPPMLPALVGHNGISRFFCLYYLGSKANWDTGWQSATFPYYAGFEPLINHPTIAMHLFGKDLGSDDGPPEHALLCDRKTLRIYVGGWQEVREFLRLQNSQPPAPTEEELNHMARMDLGEMREMGMFEFVLGATEDKRQLCAELVAWLDQQITAELLDRLNAAAGSGDLNALYILMRFTQRIRPGSERDNESG